MVDLRKLQRPPQFRRTVGGQDRFVVDFFFIRLEPDADVP
jgi:hypothetical protein